jgi:hypothetical protein
MLLERDVALAALDDALARARAGGGRIVLVSGEAGIGKTALVRHAARASEDRARFLGRYRMELPRRALGDGLRRRRPRPANADAIRDWTVDYFDALHPHSAGGAYVNMMMDDEGEDRVRAGYRDNYDRLAEIKAAYDPGNLFRVNQNIAPASRA